MEDAFVLDDHSSTIDYRLYHLFIILSLLPSLSPPGQPGVSGLFQNLSSLDAHLATSALPIHTLAFSVSLLYDYAV